MRRGCWASHAEGALSAHGGHEYARISFYQQMTQKQSSLAEPLGRRPKGLKSREKQFKHVLANRTALATIRTAH